MKYAGSVHRKRFFVIGALAACAIALNLFFYVFGWLSTPPGMVFTGQLYLQYDVPTYWAKMLPGTYGEFTYRNLFTTEDSNIPTLLYAQYALLGLIARIFSLDILTVFFSTQVLLGIGVLAASFFLLHVWIPDYRQRIFAYVLIVGASGLGWMDLSLRTMDLYVSDLMPVDRFMRVPHASMAHILFFIALAGIYCVVERGKRVWSIGVGAVLFLMNIVLPFHGIIAYTLLGVWMVVQTFFDHAFFRKHSALVGAFILSSSSLFFMKHFYDAYPLVRAFQNEALMIPPPLPLTVLALGVPFLLAVFEIVRRVVKQALTRTDMLAALWLASVFGWMYFSALPMRRRFIETAVYIPIAYFASAVFARSVSFSANGFLSNSIPRICVKVSIGIVVVGILCGSTFAKAKNMYQFITQRSPGPPAYYKKDTIAALEWLKDNSPSDAVILTEFRTGNITPAFSERMVYVGHSPETLSLIPKVHRMRLVYRHSLEDAAAYEFLVRNRIGFVLFGDEERAGSRVTQLTYPFLEEAYRSGGEIMYRVRK